MSCSSHDLIAAWPGGELLFRGCCEPVRRLVRPWPGVVAASILFGLILIGHYAVLAAFVGCYLSWVLIMTDNNLFAVMVAHGVYDFVALVYLVKFER